MRRKGRRRFIETYEFPPALRSKLVAELRSAHAADVALDGLRGWYLACLYADGALIGMPSHAVDEAWHEMILMTRHYTSFCDRAFGRYLHHNPDSTLSVSMDEILVETLAIVDAHDLPMTLFTADDDAGLDYGYIWTATDLRRMRDTIDRRERDRRARRRAACAAGARLRLRRLGDGGSWSFFGFGGGGDGGGGVRRRRRRRVRRRRLRRRRLSS